MPTQYVENSSVTERMPGTDDVVIMVPEIDGDPLESVLLSDIGDHAVCIETDADLEPSSPKTITESSSKYLMCL